MRTAIHWFRRDLRLTDNTALNAAAAAAEHVVPVYVLSAWQGQHHWTGPNRQEFLCACLQALAGNLAAIGSRLLIRTGQAEQELERLVADTGAEAIFYNRDPDPFGRAVETRLAALADRLGITVSAHQDVALHAGEELLAGSGAPYRVYAPYFKAWSKRPKAAVGPTLKRLSTPRGIASDPLPDLSHWQLASEGARLIEAGERAARRRLQTFVSANGAAMNYAVGRTQLTGQTTSRFSQDLRWGLLSVREVYHRCRTLAAQVEAPAQAHLDKLIGEIAWRDFYFQILHHFPGVLDDDFSPATRGLPWRRASEHRDLFARWGEGTTGFPIVDAGMRQLSALGYMHNRLRMITAMFLTKDLRIHWREGEAFFLRKLVDGEVASNNGGWQWSAGTGADAAPTSASRTRGRRACASIPRASTSGSGCRSCATCRRAGCTCRWPRACGWPRTIRRRCSTTLWSGTILCACSRTTAPPVRMAREPGPRGREVFRKAGSPQGITSRRDRSRSWTGVRSSRR